MRVLRSEEQQPMYVSVREPWSTDFLQRPQSSSGFASTTSSVPFVTNNSDLAAASIFNPLPPVTEEVSSPGVYELPGTPPNRFSFIIADVDEEEEATQETAMRRTDENEEFQDTYDLRQLSSSTCCGDGLLSWIHNFYCLPTSSSGRSTRILSLKPRRIARLPPVLPATFLLVACFSIASGKHSATV
ncbi:unnamed protein product [Echinostoma caproni]|uniref:Uncharacterized protein n=1 Tax=Echinostoma caproni TaxID=27848 RepID=A0A183BDF5_9TREM|nr:unnamed protein product [Echinostoma caproni]